MGPPRVDGSAHSPGRSDRPRRVVRSGIGIESARVNYDRLEEESESRDDDLAEDQNTAPDEIDNPTHSEIEAFDELTASVHHVA